MEIDIEQLFEKLSSELSFKKQSEKFRSQLEQIDIIIKSSNSYKEYLKKTTTVFKEIRKEKSAIIYQIADWYSKNHCYHIRPEWRKELDMKNLIIPFIVAENPLNSNDTFSDYLNDEKLYNSKYKNDKYLIYQLVFSPEPKTHQKEILIDKFLKYLNKHTDVYEFLDAWIRRTIETTLKDQKMYNDTIRLLREERISIFEYISSRKALLDKSNFDEVKEFFEHDKLLVKQNENMYPILLNYMDFIKKEILYANYHKPTDKNVFMYIANLTFSKKWVDVKSYYHSKFLDLNEIKK